jgi:hypothetical protein
LEASLASIDIFALFVRNALTASACNGEHVRTR